jgi:uncharacterized protein YciI
MADQEWQFAQFPGPNGHQDAATFLNDPLRQGHGEASVTLRNDASAGLIYFEPGSLGTDTSPSWLVAEFPSAQDAADYLNADPRQGPGEASATLRNDGSAGLVYLEPGRLGRDTSPSWLTAEFPSAQDAVAYLNAAPRQGAGEAVGFIRNNGSAAIFYLEPGSA